MNSTNLLLFLILLLGLFFRTYKLETFYIFNHDQDLYSWIVKDILVDHHLRLIGQLTSINGVFIGPLFYYLLIPFFLLSRLDPIGATILTTLIGLATIFSLYFVFSRFFDKNAGLIAAFLYAVSIPSAFFDRWVVPTQPAILWSVWFLYAIFLLQKGDRRSLFIIAVLLALIWHIHLVLMPLALLIPLAVFLSDKKVPAKKYISPAVLFVFLMFPFWFFEIRHGFQQTLGLLGSFTQKTDYPNGLYRLSIIISNASHYLWANLPFNYDKIFYPLNFLPLVGLSIFLKYKKILTYKYILILLSWVVLIIFPQFLQRKAVSEYYFSSLMVVSLLIFSLFIAYLFKSFGKIIVLFLLLLFLVFNFFMLLKTSENRDVYLYKKQVVQYIKNDADAHRYPCVSISYIADFGSGVGFRYLFWFEDVRTILPGKGAPIYNIVIPWGTAASEIDIKFGQLGVINPKKQEFIDDKVCTDPKNQLVPLLGFVN